MGNTSDPRSGPKEGAGPAPGGAGTGTAGDPANAGGGGGNAVPAASGSATPAGATAQPQATGERGRTVTSANKPTDNRQSAAASIPLTTGPAPGGVEEADRYAEHVKGRRGPKNPPVDQSGGVAPSGQPGDEPQATRQRPETVIDKTTGRDVTPGYAGPKVGAVGFVASSNFDVEPTPGADPPVLPKPRGPADPRPGDFKPGHSGGVPTPPYTEEQAKSVMPAGSSKETE